MNENLPYSVKLWHLVVAVVDCLLFWYQCCNNGHRGLIVGISSEKEFYC